MIRHRLAAFAFLTIVGVSLTTVGQGRPDPTLIAAQREAMIPLANMDGVWRGPAWTILASGEKHTITQTERIGPFLDGSVKVIEGRGYESDGKVTLSDNESDTDADLFTSYRCGESRIRVRVIRRSRLTLIPL